LSSLSPPFDTQFKVVVDKPLTNKAVKIEETEEDDGIEEVEATLVQDYDFNDNRTKKQPQTCSSCQTTCANEQYCSTTQKDFYLCRSCFITGKYSFSQKSGNFVIERLGAEKKEGEEQEGDTDDKQWTEKEQESLQEGLGLYHDNWEKIADHVGTRTHDECILHYLELPNNDSPFEKDAEIAKLGLLQYDLIEHRENPIMAAVAFLASGVEPKVAAAAGHIQPIQEIIPKEKEAEKMIEEEKEGEDTEPKINGTTVEEEKKDMEEDDKPARSDAEEEDLLELTNTLIKFKLKQYEQQTTQYDLLENIVEKQKRQLEKERRQLDNNQLVLKNKIISIRTEMIKKIQAAQAKAAKEAQAQAAAQAAQAQVQNSSGITPAQLQQQLAQAQTQQQQMSPSLFLNRNNASIQQLHHQQQQQLSQQQQQLSHQQYQLQMQMQMQGQMPRPNGSNGPGNGPNTGFNNMMPL
jgi:SWI/SNF related-matrix-associated actin-dependent regulator of chromatin subfamily C